jgi:probable phosphoglycerate mutase
VAVVSHADPIKALLALWLGISLDGFARFEIAPATFSAVDLHGYGAVVRCLGAGLSPAAR